jgi:hypothetical protein
MLLRCCYCICTGLRDVERHQVRRRLHCTCHPRDTVRARWVLFVLVLRFLRQQICADLREYIWKWRKSISFRGRRLNAILLKSIRNM